MRAFIYCLVIFTTIAAHVHASVVDCSFNERRSFCRWKREWFGTRRGAWKRNGGFYKNAPLMDSPDNFAYCRARNRPEGFRSRLRSPSVVVRNNSCFVFGFSSKGSKKAYPEGLQMLRVYLVGTGESPDRRLPIFENKAGSWGRMLRKEVIALDEALKDIKSVSMQFVIEAVRGGSGKAVVKIDDVGLYACTLVAPTLFDGGELKRESSNTRNSRPRNVMLAGQVPSPLVKVYPGPSEGSSLSPTSGRTDSLQLIGHLQSGTPTSAHEFTNRKWKKQKKRKSRRRHRNRNRGGRRKNRKQDRNRITTIGDSPASSILPILRPVMCDFIEYTRRLQGCLRTFFQSLQNHRTSCRTSYSELEVCLQNAAQSCIPSRDLSRERIGEILNSTLRENFQTRQVYCEEEGAFVFPEFAVAKQSLQCGPRYFQKLTECSGPFSRIFQLKHGNPSLCKEYYAANECQRQSTAEECNFDAETMMKYGLSLQYQFAHNPFCLHLPFSSWWPAS